jgi:hypothetical protein
MTATAPSFAAASTLEKTPKASDVRNLRERLGMSQPGFALDSALALERCGSRNKDGVRQNGRRGCF